MTVTRAIHDRAGLKARLDQLYLEYNRAEAVADPIEIVRRYSRPDDREVVGFCAAALAFGRVASVLQSVERLLAIMGPSPAAFIRQFDRSRDGRLFDGLGHRWTRSHDLIALVQTLHLMVRHAGSIEQFFLQGHRHESSEIGVSIEAFSRRALALSPAPVGEGRGPGVAYFFPCPSSGSACKRLNLYLRWMVRSDSIDLGVWSGVSPAQLVVPLDVHVIRLGQCLGLTRYRSPGWRMAADLTQTLRAFDPVDPVRYDFALCHVGMRDQCGFNRPFRDERCPLRGWCRPGARRSQSSRRPSARR
ncbi:MAG TPA: TIGR02757 family protein [Vicinamibacterales bacterium]